MKIALCTFYPIFKGSGGAEKVFWNMANEFCNRGHEVTAIGFEEGYSESFYKHDPKIKAFNAGSTYNRSFWINMWSMLHLGLENRRVCRDYYEGLRKGKLLKGLIQKAEPEVIISYQLEVTYVLKEILHVNIPVITMFHNSIEVLLDNKQRFFKALENCECIQVLLPSYMESLKKYLTPKQVVYIPNIVPQYNEIKTTDSKVILHIGRFDHSQKKQHLLIEAFAQIAPKFKDWKVEFWGSMTCYPEYTEYCQKLVAQHNLQQQIKFCGVSSDIESILAHGSIFAFPSSFEGFPLALTEAMSKGIPTIGFKTCTGTNELIKHEHNGLLIDDGVENLAQALIKLMNDADLRAELGNQAHLDMKEYEPKKIWDSWEKLCESMVHGDVVNTES